MYQASHNLVKKGISVDTKLGIDTDWFLSEKSFFVPLTEVYFSPRLSG